jgi:hypothetical protein
MKNLLLITMISIFTTNLTFAANQCHLPTLKGKDYLTNRVIFIKNGWTPKITHQSKNNKTPEELFSTAAKFWNNGEIEVEDCASTGTAPCIFNFIKNTHTLTVITNGEEDFEHKKYHAQITKTTCN